MPLTLGQVASELKAKIDETMADMSPYERREFLWALQGWMGGFPPDPCPHPVGESPPA